MVARDCRPRYPPDGTVCADRRPGRRPASAPWPSQEAARRRAGAPGGRPGAARCAVRSITGCGCVAGGSGACSPTCRISRATTSVSSGRAADLQDHAPLGGAVPVVGRRAAAAECHPGLPYGTSRQTVRHSELAGHPWPPFRVLATPAHSRSGGVPGQRPGPGLHRIPRPRRPNPRRPSVQGPGDHHPSQLLA